MEVLQQLQTMLHAHNPYVQGVYSVMHAGDTQELMMVIDSGGASCAACCCAARRTRGAQCKGA